jgi:hypothetical protein
MLKIVESQFCLRLAATFDNMKRLGFRETFVSTEEKAGARTEASQTTEPQLFYIVHCRLAFCHLFVNLIYFFTSSTFFVEVNISNSLNATSNPVAGPVDVIIFSSITTCLS